MNMEFIRRFLPLYVEGAKITFFLGMAGILGALILGFLVALVRRQKVPVLNQIAGIYVEISRNTPLLIQLFFLYFGLPKVGIVMSSEVCAVVGLIFLGGSYMAESFRAGLDAVDPNQEEAALSVGLSRAQVFRYVILPQAISVAMPSFHGNVIFLLKETSVFSAVALADLMYVAKDLIGLYYETDEALLLLVISYLILLLPITFLMKYLERRLRHGQHGTRAAA
ncbi:MAG: amino acid ABC transporter permease [Tissierellia bacterium]|nr:amino acid ABC transporter permease [Tissierellia bacterium]